MDIAEGIRKFGFRRWYERQLIESHVYLVTGILSLILVLACLEEFSVSASGWRITLMLALMVAGGMLCVWSMARYHVMLGHAQHAAEHSVCAQCGSRGALEVVKSSAVHDEFASRAEAWLGVRCRNCGHEWMME